MKKVYLLFFLLHFTFKICEAQFILAGTVSGKDTYFDIVPDSALEALNVHLSPYPGETIKLDVDSDGIQDYQIDTYGGGGLGGGTGGCVIVPLGAHASVASHMDTSAGCCPAQYIAQLVDTLVMGDTISNALSFYSGTNYLWSTTYGMAQAPIISEWNDIGEHYIGIRLNYPQDTLYGWIRVEATNSGIFILTVKDMACNKNQHIGITEIYNSQKLIIAPNPFSDQITVLCSDCSDALFVLYNFVSGKTLEKKITKSFLLNTEQLAKGIYLYEVRNINGVIKKGKAVKN